MKTHEEIKNGLECCISDTYGCYEKCPYFNSLSNGVDCALKMHADALAYITQLEARVPKWISVKERKPEGVVLVANFAPGTEGYKKIDVADAFDAGNSDITFYLLNGVDVEYNVTHWMPIPDAPPEKG